MGLESSIVGVTKFCVHPLHIRKSKTIVGGTKNVHLKKIKALNPDIILCNKEENTKEMIAELENIAPVHISDIYSIADCLELIEHYGVLFQKKKAANNIIEDITKAKNDFKSFINKQQTRTVAYFIWKKPWMVAAKNTFIDEMLEINKFHNYFVELQRYPEVELDEKNKETADIVLLSSEPFPFKEKHKEAMKKYFPHSKILIVDGEAFSWYGTRLIEAFDYFKSLHQNHLKVNASGSK